ncbi:MAG: LysM peptidoglycan-binding domain-containing protein [Chloroflexota bacterium]
MKNRFMIGWASLKILSFAALTLLLGFTILPAHAQSEDASCPALVEQALFQLGSSCTSLDRNSACYGYNRVNATFSQSVAPDFFSNPSDRSPIATLKTIETAPLNLTTQQWGIAVMNVQANVPDTLPGQAVTFLLMGDTQVENAVTASEASAGPATAITQKDATLQSDASAESNALGQIPAGTVLQIDATSYDLNWLKVTSGIGVGWITQDTVNQTPAIASLPVDDQASLSPMQAFYFRNGAAQSACEETPSVLAIQSPENIHVDLTANGANIRLGSLITLQILPDGTEMQLTTLEGMATLDADSANPINVPAGFTTTRCLSPAANLGSDGESNDQKVGIDCAWQEPTIATDEQLAQGDIVRGAIIQLNLQRAEVTQSTPTPPAGDDCPSGATIVHVVSPGENLFRIGLRYKTGMGAIMQANSLTNPQVIYAGQQLVIPCGVDTGLPSVPQPVIPVSSQTVTTPVDCSKFRATSPLDGLPYGMATFYWDGAPGATGYRVNIFNQDERGGALVGSFASQGTNTNLTADLSIESVGYGFSFAWEVQAIYNEQVACGSLRYTVPRQAKPAPQSNTPGFSASWACTGSLTLTVTYSNVPAGDTSVTITFLDSMGGPMGSTLTVPPTSGSSTFSGIFNASAGVVTSSPSGTTRTLPGTLSC